MVRKWATCPRTTEVHEPAADVAVCAPVHGARVAGAVVGRCHDAVLAVVAWGKDCCCRYASSWTRLVQTGGPPLLPVQQRRAPQRTCSTQSLPRMTLCTITVGFLYEKRSPLGNSMTATPLGESLGRDEGGMRVKKGRQGGQWGRPAVLLHGP